MDKIFTAISRMGLMLALLSPRIWLAIGLAVILAASHGFAYKSGRAAVRAGIERADWRDQR